jgi:hypothetical protein
MFQILPESGSAFDPDPQSYKMPDLYPDPHIINTDPKHWVAVSKYECIKLGASQVNQNLKKKLKSFH